MKEIYCVCYNTLFVFESKELARKFFSECFYGSDGSEQSRYGSILVDLQFTNIGKDNVDNYVREISYHDKDNNVIRTEKIEKKHYEKVIKEIEERG